jgi:hypothetical protein
MSYSSGFVASNTSSFSHVKVLDLRRQATASAHPVRYILGPNDLLGILMSFLSRASAIYYKIQAVPEIVMSTYTLPSFKHRASESRTLWHTCYVLYYHREDKVCYSRYV